MTDTPEPRIGWWSDAEMFPNGPEDEAVLNALYAEAQAGRLVIERTKDPSGYRIERPIPTITTIGEDDA